MQTELSNLLVRYFRKNFKRPSFPHENDQLTLGEWAVLLQKVVDLCPDDAVSYVAQQEYGIRNFLSHMSDEYGSCDECMVIMGNQLLNQCTRCESFICDDCDKFETDEKGDYLCKFCKTNTLTKTQMIDEHKNYLGV